MRLGLRELVLMAMLVAMPLGAWWQVFRPRNMRDAELRAKIEEKQRKLQALNHATATIGDLERQITSLEAGLWFFQSKLPSEKEIDRVLQDIWRMAEADRLVTKSIRTISRKESRRFTTAAGPHAEQPIIVQLEGDFLGFYTFLQTLENQPRIMRVQDMTLKKLEKGRQGRMQATFVMSVFFERSKGRKS